ncbi:MAG TPA: hypothetical protein PLN58_06500 [Bacilli bacterium]|nr:hypothetical protein [Bacteroidales bacterium]HQP14319.1 hypothetical protein [Bacilli bacterium]
MKTNNLFLLISIIIFGSCANQVKYENRLEQEFNYGSVTYMDYQLSDNSGNNDAYGKLIFGKNSITSEMIVDGQLEKEEFRIKTVTYEKSPNELRYRTYQGDFIVKLENDKISVVNFYSSSFLAIFNKATEINLIQHKLPINIGVPLKDWNRIVIANVGTIDLSPKLEIQAGSYKEKKAEIVDVTEKIWGFKYNEPKLVLQPKGVNQFDESSLSKYSRVIVETINGNPNEFQRLNEKIEITGSDLSTLDFEYKNQVKQSFSNTPLNLIEWYPLKINEINGMPCLHINYKRQYKDQPYVIVDTYKFFNYDRVISLTISYRQVERDYWLKTLDNTLKSFRITNIK